MKKQLTILLALIICIANFNATKAQSIQLETKSIKDSIYSKTFLNQKNIWVQLPENYNPTSHQKYPVVFIQDGDVMLSTLKTVYKLRLEKL